MQFTGALAQWWADPTVRGIGRLPARTDVRSYPDADHARRSIGAWWTELTSGWVARVVPDPTHAPANWTTSAVDGWTPIEVPGNWTMQAAGRHAGDLPHYTNIVMPFGGDPPSIPERPIAGLYRRTVTRAELVSAGAIGADRRCILHIGGADSAAAVWWNGTFVGIMSDSRLPSEFDVTPWCVKGANELAIMVVRWTAHTWLEDQDHWFHAGLHRRVAIRSAGATSIADLVVDAVLDARASTGELTVSARIDGPADGWKVTSQLETLGGRSIPRTRAHALVPVFDSSSQLASMVDAYHHPGPVATITTSVAYVRPWSHEDPHRYRLIVKLVDPAGEVRETIPVVTGFRSVAITGAELLLNGRPIVIAGVNRHDHHHLTGKAVSDEAVRNEIRAIRCAGFNAMRTAHYPPDPVLLDACDEFGLWVICEANLESHARWRELIDDPRYAPAYIERVQRMVATHRNHPSVIAWSLGNESGYGAAHDAAAAWVRRTDPTRFVHYEGANSDYWRVGGPQSDDRASDIECPMYPSVEALVRWATASVPTRPLIMCEYSHAMGNSNGDLERYWSAIERYHGLQGGFIWDWRDQGLVAPEVTGHRAPVYGGAFGDAPHDAAFCCNGLVGADGSPHPAIEEHRWLTRPIRSTFSHADGRLTMRVRNRFVQLSTAVLRATVEVAIDGVVISRTGPTVDVLPGQSAVVDLGPIDLPGGEVTATVHWAARRTQPWADRGQVVAWDQTILVRRSTTRPDSDASGHVPTVLGDGGTPTLWRPPTDNDGQRSGPLAGVVGPLVRWQRWGLEHLTQVSSTTWMTGDGTSIMHRRRVSPVRHGAHIVDIVELPERLDDVPRVGIHLRLPASLTSLRWYGRGPWETASDRRAAPLGIWESTVADQYVSYAVPQHCGSHIDTRWLELTDGSGTGIRIEFVRAAHFDVSQYAPATLGAARTAADLSIDSMIHLHIDAAVRGVGTGACGPDTSVRVPTGRHRIEWVATQLSRRTSRSRSSV